MTLEIRRISKSFAGLPTLVNIDLTINRGELVCLLGPSGCGKTTLLKIVAGLLAPNSGDLRLNNESILTLPARERRFGIVFQSYSLFPHMTIYDNIAYGLRLRKYSRVRIRERVNELLAMIHLPELGDRFPGQLSGGQQQRVALARALATDPGVLLLDEPLSALDARVRTQLRTEIREIQQRLQIPTLMVTHDQEEAMTMADRIVCMQSGKIAQAGTARELYQTPASRFVAEFMGHSNILNKTQALRCWPGLRHHLHDLKPDQKLLCVRPEHLHVAPQSELSGTDDTRVSTDAIITQVLFVGNTQRIQLQCEDVLLWSECPPTAAWQVNDRVSLHITPREAVWVDA